jgi:HEAT repeat protein
MVTLQPTEHCLAFVRAYDEQDNGQPKEFKVVLRRPQASAAGSWTGVLETPPRPAKQTLVQPEALTGALPMPEHFPHFTYAFTGVNWSGQESVVEALWYSNRELFDLLPIYDPAAVREEFERRMRAEKRLPVKLFLAVVAARAGSEEAGLFLLETMKDADYLACVNVHGALWRLFPYPRTEPPAWVVELSMAALADNRFVTGLEKTNWTAGAAFTVASCGGGNLEFALCESKCSKALPLLIERLKKGQSSSYTAVMLGRMGDKRAVPFLMEMVETAGKIAKHSKAYGLSEEFSRPAYALAELKAHEAVPLLLRYIEFPEIIGDLGEMGDRLAVPVLQKLVSARGKITRDGKDVYPDLEQERLFAAKVALAGFDQVNGATHLGEMLGDQSLSVQQRYDVAMCLGRRQDPKGIPYLVRAIKTESRIQPANRMVESRYFLIDMAIGDLGEFKYKAAVEGLIGCFDVDFKEEELGKGEHVTPATYRNRIARSLQAITGQSFGADKRQWLKWWQEKGRQSAELK